MQKVSQEAQLFMKILEALLVEGTSKFAILCYGIFPEAVLERALEQIQNCITDQNSVAYSFMGEGWPNGLLLIETLVSDETNIVQCMLSGYSKLFALDQCLGAICMYDGAFGKYEDLFSSEIAYQIYGFCLSINSPVINLDSDAVGSKAWQEIIEMARLQFICNALAAQEK